MDEKNRTNIYLTDIKAQKSCCVSKKEKQVSKKIIKKLTYFHFPENYSNKSLAIGHTPPIEFFDHKNVRPI